MNTTGILLALLTLLGEDPENPSMEPWLTGILTKYKAHIDAGYLPDGSYAEPVGYTSTDTEPLLTEAGLVNYYKNLYYRQFYIQPIAHNTVLLNDYPESQQTADFDNDIQALDNYPRITSCFNGDVMDSVEGDVVCL